MAAMSKDAAFWSKISRKYSAGPIRDMDGYLRTLDRTKSYLQPTDRVLEMGCGSGSTALLLAPHVAHITATDLAPGMIEIANEKLAAESVDNVTFKVAEAQGHRTENAAYDAVLAHNLLHLLPELDGALAHVSMLLKPGGLFIAKTVCAPDRGGFKYGVIRYVAIPIMQAVGKAPFVRFDTAEDLQKKLCNAGFEVVETGLQSGMLPSLYTVARKV